MLETSFISFDFFKRLELSFYDHPDIFSQFFLVLLNSSPLA